MELPRPIRSASHPLALQARALDRGARQRREEGLFPVEGPRGVAEALDAGADLVWALVATSRIERPDLRELLERCLAAGVPVQPVRDDLLGRITPAEHGPGLLGACRLPAGADRPAVVLDRPGDGLVPVLWEIQDPGSTGTLVRSAAAFGAAGVLAAGGADPWNPKAVRASAGAVHRLPVARAAGVEDLTDVLREAGYRLVAAVPRDGRPPEQADWSGRVALLLGGEVRGLPDEALATAEPVTIPTSGLVESLSVPIAGSILLAAAQGCRGRREPAS